MDWTDRIGRRLTPRDLHVFLAVAEEGTMAKAAERLSVSRPVVSRTITDLEALLGVRLLDRTPGGMVPTAYGEALARRSLAVFDELRQGIQDIAALADPNAGLLRIGTTEVTAGGIVAATIARMSARYPRLRFSTERGGVHLRMDLLRERRVDIFVTRPLTAEPDPDMVHEPLLCEELVVVCGAGSRWAKRRRVGLAELVDEAWIVAPAEVAADGPIAKGFQAAGLPLPPSLLMSDSLTVRYSLLATGRYVTVIPHLTFALSPCPHWIREVPVARFPWHLPTVIATLRHRSPTPTAKLFIAEARTVVSEIASQS